jgi:hypothetical protein
LKRRRKKPHRVHLGERGIYIFESRHSPDFHMELVAQDFLHLYVVREGRGYIETESERLPIRENQLVYVPVHTAQRPVVGPDAPLTLILLLLIRERLRRMHVRGRGAAPVHAQLPGADALQGRRQLHAP